jgi:hypothetical protein
MAGAAGAAFRGVGPTAPIAPSCRSPARRRRG